MNDNISLVVPTTKLDVEKFLLNSNEFFSKLPIKNVYLICNTIEIRKKINDPRIKLFEEANLIQYSTIKQLLISRSSNYRVERRTGWYLQQFLKMAYARICTDEFYLLWDSDTLPLRTIEVFDKDGKMYLDYKIEYNKPYFDTLSRLIPGYKKLFERSFIAEHMLIKTKHMRELLDIIEANDNIPGKYFYEKIINAVAIEHLHESGFSEFETYGTFVFKNYINEYNLRQWHSFRFGGLFFSSMDMMNNNLVRWLSSYYHAISFEKNHYQSTIRRIAHNKFLVRTCSPRVLNILSLIVRIKRKIFNM